MVKLEFYEEISERGSESKVIFSTTISVVNSKNVSRSSNTPSRRSEKGFDYIDNIYNNLNEISMDFFVSDFNRLDNSGVRQLKEKTFKIKGLKHLNVARKDDGTVSFPKTFDKIIDKGLLSEEYRLKYYSDWIDDVDFIKGIEDSLTLAHDSKMFVRMIDTKRGRVHENYIIKSLNISESGKTTNGFSGTMSLIEARIGQTGTGKALLLKKKKHRATPAKKGGVSGGKASKITEKTDAEKTLSRELYDKVGDLATKGKEKIKAYIGG